MCPMGSTCHPSNFKSLWVTKIANLTRFQCLRMITAVKFTDGYEMMHKQNNDILLFFKFIRSY